MTGRSSFSNTGSDSRNMCSKTMECGMETRIQRFHTYRTSEPPKPTVFIQKELRAKPISRRRVQPALEVLKRLRQPLPERNARLPAQHLARLADVRAAPRRIVHRKRLEHERAF